MVPMTDDLDAVEFSRAWEAAWNRRDVEAVLQHFHDDVVFTSPVAKQVGFANDGVVRGKDALRRYWTAALAQNPDLHFRVSTIYRGINTIVIGYKNQSGIDRAEVLTFRNGLVVEGHGAFVAG